MKTQPTHIIVSIEDLDFEIDCLKGRLLHSLDNPTRNHLKGQIEAYLAVKMQNKVCIPDKKTL